MIKAPHIHTSIVIFKQKCGYETVFAVVTQFSKCDKKRLKYIDNNL